MERGPDRIASLPDDFDAVLNFGAWDDDAALASRLGPGASGYATTVHPLLGHFDRFGWLRGALASRRDWKRVRAIVAWRTRCTPTSDRRGAVDTESLPKPDGSLTTSRALVPIVVDMDIALKLGWLGGCALRARVRRHAAQTIDRPHDVARRIRVAPGSIFRRALGAALVAGAPFIASAQPTPEPSAGIPTIPTLEAATALTVLLPASVFFQAGAAAHVHTGSLGAIWPLPWQRDVSFGRLTTSIEAAFGEWQTLGQRHHSHPFTQVGFTPSLRFYPDAWHGRWFVEAGIGANVIAPSYHTDGKRFSTAFNFGDHVAIGREFGARHQQEIALRIEHFSNAGIDHPNPGENFLQLRWVVRF